MMEKKYIWNIAIGLLIENMKKTSSRISTSLSKSFGYIASVLFMQLSKTRDNSFNDDIFLWLVVLSEQPLHISVATTLMMTHF